MPIYRITFPNRTPVDVQGVSIATQNVSVVISPTLPRSFALRGAHWSNGIDGLMSSIFSYSFPYICNTYNYPDGLRQEVNFCGTNANGQVGSGTYQNYIIRPGSWYITPGQQTVIRCDALVTTATGNVLRLQGDNGQPCPTWVTTPDNECRPDEIKCTDLSDPRGFCCISCDALNTKIRVLI